MKSQKVTSPAGSSASRPRRWYDDACGTAFALELVGERWSLLIVRELMLGGRRFTDLRASLNGISAKVLTERLESLEQAGVLVRRKLPPPVSAQVYELTEWGYMAEPAIAELGRWAARSAKHDTSLPLSPVSMMLSLRTMLDHGKARELKLTVQFAIGEERFVGRVLDGELPIERGEMPDADLRITAPVAMPIAAMVYGKVPVEALAEAGLEARGDAALLARFVDLFHLPEKVG